ncbi:MAG: M14 family metallopeptidase [Gemmatimonadota bacterium]|nr:M14 family metallopeptidase [Gemmatimonadota bacterium]
MRAGEDRGRPAGASSFGPSRATRAFLAWLALAAAVVAPPAARGQEAPPQRAAADRPLPLPEDVLGFQPGEPRRLADWGAISAYLDTLAAASDRIVLDTIGRSTLDRPLTLLTISSPRNLERLEELREIQARLADPRRIRDAEERADLVRRGRLVVAVTAGLHSTEVAGSLLPVRLAYRLASSDAPDVQRILDETVVLVVPSLNPDGTDLVADWYRATIDMPWEGSPPPFLYHHYAGHDNNRDWYAFTLAETRAVVERVHLAWRPHIVHDVHQQGTHASRLFLPPWIDPIEPNVDPLLVGATNALGTAVAWSLLREGRSGVLVAGDFDAWDPGRAWPLYHGAVRILSETASARLATPVTVPFEQLEAGRGYDPKRASWNFPRPWPGGEWTLADALSMMEAASLAVLREASGRRTDWLRTFVAVGERAVAGRPGRPAAWAIPPAAHDSGAVEALVDALVTGGVEVERSAEAFRAAGRGFPAGTYLVPMRQPYAAFAQVLLAPKPYPPAFDGRGPDATPVPPYGWSTAHTLALLLGAEAVPLAAVPAVPAEPVRETDRPRRRAEMLAAEAGTLIGLYRPWVPAENEGWARWWFDRAGVPYAVLRDEDLVTGGLPRDWTAILLPSIAANALAEGWQPGEQPPAYTGGLAGEGARALRSYVEGGGTLVAIGGATDFAIQALGLPVDQPLRDLPDEDFLAPGAIVSLAVDSAAAVAAGTPRRLAAWLNGPYALQRRPGSGARVIARFGARPTVLSGWVHGESHLAGATAALEVPLGRGRVVLFAFDPLYRGQARASVPLLFAALARRGLPD